MKEYSCTFFCNLHDFELPTDFDTVEFNERVSLSASASLRDDFMSESVVNYIGLSEALHTHKLMCFTVNNRNIKQDQFSDRHELMNFLKLNAILCEALWLIKDNSIRPELAHLVFSDHNGGSIHTNFINTLYTNCKAKFEKTSFTLEEIHEAKEYFLILAELAFGPLNPYTRRDNQVNRINRSLLFLQAARIGNDLGEKVSNYCSAFECLFSVASSELRHRLSESIGFFLESEGYEPIEVYSNLKAAYDLRSSVVHGDSIPKKFTNNNFALLLKTVADCDQYSRVIIKKIISNKDLVEMYSDSKNTRLSKYLIDLIFARNKGSA